MSHLDRRTLIMDRLKQEGLRITTQRKLLVDVILQNECSSCKEIYYQATKVDASVGIATVYRMIKTLEDLSLIQRKNLYNISYENLNVTNKSQAVFVKEEEKHVIQLDQAKWFSFLEKELREQGLIGEHSSVTLVIKENVNQLKDGEQNDQLYYRCECDNIGCGYHSKRNQTS